MKKANILFVFSCLSALISSCNGCDEYSPAPSSLKTRWTDGVKATNVLPEYPRPQMIRSRWKNLNGVWDYAIADSSLTSFPENVSGKILVPFALEAPLSGVGRHLEPNESLWYRRTFKVPGSWAGNRILLNFGAVDYFCQVFINGNLAFSHKGGYTPFSVDATPFVWKGENTLEVKVLDSTGGYQPRGKQMYRSYIIWYTSTSGIWQTVWMECVNKDASIKYVYPSTKGNLLTIDIASDGVIREDDIIEVEVLEGGVGLDNPACGKVVAKAEGRWPLEIQVDEAQRWSPESPYRYGLKIKLLRGGKILDKVRSYTAFRDLSLHDGPGGHKCLSTDGKPVFHFGPLDQGFWPDGIYTAPCDEALLFDIKRAKDFGFNMIRKHVKVEPSRWYAHCDREGIYVWQDMPSQCNVFGNIWLLDSYGGTEMDIPEEDMINFQREWTEVIEMCKFFPCITTWVPFNESWGQMWTENTVELTRSIDSTRFINPASGGNLFRCGDIVDFHNYPEPKYYFFEPGYASVIGEYGGIGYAVDSHVWSTDGSSWCYTKQSAEDVIEEYEKFASDLAVFASEGIAGAVYTQITDVETEINGLMTYDREVDKFPVDRIRTANKKVILSLCGDE